MMMYSSTRGGAWVQGMCFCCSSQVTCISSQGGTKVCFPMVKGFLWLSDGLSSPQPHPQQWLYFPAQTLLEIYREEWLHRQMRYLSACQQHSKGLQHLKRPVPHYQEAAPFQLCATFWQCVWAWSVGQASFCPYSCHFYLSLSQGRLHLKGVQKAAANAASWEGRSWQSRNFTVAGEHQKCYKKLSSISEREKLRFETKCSDGKARSAAVSNSSSIPTSPSYLELRNLT